MKQARQQARLREESKKIDVADMARNGNSDSDLVAEREQRRVTKAADANAS